MQEILFRGKRVDNGKWVCGCLVSIEASNIKTTDAKTNQKVYCITNPYIPFEITVNDADNLDLALYRVIPETVGQYTGLTDKNGTKIFEGDIVVVNIKGYNTICKVAWADNVAQFQLWQTNTIPHTPTALNLGNYDCEVIGNIHDNPELLKELGK